MKWAFWRRRKPRATGPGRTDAQQGEEAVRSGELAVDPGGVRAGHAAQIRVRMRRRLIGAAALLLSTAVVVPMMLDPAPRPLPDNIPIDIPSERTPFAPRLSLPATASGAAAPDATAGKPSEAHGAKDGQGASSGSATEANPSAAGAKEAGAIDEPPTVTEGSPGEAQSAKPGQWFVQAAALSSESKAHQLSDRLAKAGMAPFVERTETASGVRYRVRLGPFASRQAAVEARRHLHALAPDSKVIPVEQAER